MLTVGLPGSTTGDRPGNVEHHAAGNKKGV